MRVGVCDQQRPARRRSRRRRRLRRRRPGTRRRSDASTDAPSAPRTTRSRRPCRPTTASRPSAADRERVAGHVVAGTGRERHGRERRVGRPVGQQTDDRGVVVGRAGGRDVGAREHAQAAVGQHREVDALGVAAERQLERAVAGEGRVERPVAAPRTTTAIALPVEPTAYVRSRAGSTAARSRGVVHDARGEVELRHALRTRTRVRVSDGGCICAAAGAAKTPAETASAATRARRISPSSPRSTCCRPSAGT